MAELSVCIAVGPRESFTDLGATLDSIARQHGQAVEVVLKTAGQHLRDQINEYSRDLRADGSSLARLCLLTGPDDGIYDAFNICARNATGRYVQFLGCGDALADDFVAGDIERHVTLSNAPEFVYGPVLIQRPQGDIVSSFSNACFFGRRMVLPWRNPCHSQGLIYRREWLTEHPFRTDIGPLADLIHTQQHRLHRRASWIGRPVSMFRTGGISNQATQAAFQARLRGLMANCANYPCPSAWRALTYLVCRLDHSRRQAR